MAIPIEDAVSACLNEMGSIITVRNRLAGFFTNIM